MIESGGTALLIPCANVLCSHRTTKARDFEGEGGPEDKAEGDRRDRGGDDDVRTGRE